MEGSCATHFRSWTCFQGKVGQLLLLCACSAAVPVWTSLPGRDLYVQLAACLCAVRRPREQAEESDAFNYLVEQGAQMAKALGRSGQARTATALL